MKTNYLNILLLSLLLVLVSCKKEEETTKAFMSGRVEFDFPQYVITGQTITSYASGITQPKYAEYMWISTNFRFPTGDTLKGQSLTLVAPDEPGDYSIRAQASASDYYNSYTDHDFTVISIEGGSVEGFSIPETFIIDERDSEKYYYSQYGSLDWFVHNLRFAGDTANVDVTQRDTIGRAYQNSDEIGQIFGRLYSWNEATGGESGQGLGGGPQGICPQGWSVPTKEDWEDLAEAVGGAEYSYFDIWDELGSPLTAPITFNDKPLWPYSPDNLHSNTSGWNGIPSGNSNDNHSKFENIGQYGMWWSAVESEDGTKGNYKYIFYNNSTVNHHFVDKDAYGVSVRCVRVH